MKSTHKCEVIRVGDVQVHPNADRLEVIQVFGYSCCVAKGSMQRGDLAVYLPPDSVVPAITPFRFVWESKGWAPEADPTVVINTESVEIPEKYRRVKAKVLRGIVSEGLLMPLASLTDYLPIDQGGFPETYNLEGEDIAPMLGITHYDPPMKVVDGETEQTPGSKKKPGYPKTFNGWLRYLWSKCRRICGIQPVDQVESQSLSIPDYDVDAWQRHKHLLVPGEQVWLTEKIHGANSRYVFLDGRMWAGSHHQWKKDTLGSSWWECLRQNPWIRAFCEANPGHVLYGELVPTQKLKYGLKPQNYRLFGFDVLAYVLLSASGPEHIWWEKSMLDTVRISYTDRQGKNHVDRPLLDEAHWVPTVAEVAYDEESIRQFAEGKSLVKGSDHIREGIVIRPVAERSDPRYGRVLLKLVSPTYLGSKNSDE